MWHRLVVYFNRIPFHILAHFNALDYSRSKIDMSSRARPFPRLRIDSECLRPPPTCNNDLFLGRACGLVSDFPNYLIHGRLVLLFEVQIEDASFTIDPNIEVYGLK